MWLNCPFISNIGILCQSISWSEAPNTSEDTKFPTVPCKNSYVFRWEFTSCNTQRQMKSCDMYYRIKLKKFCLEFQTMGLVMYRSNVVPSILMKPLQYNTRPVIYDNCCSGKRLCNPKFVRLFTYVHIYSHWFKTCVLFKAMKWLKTI